MTISEKKVMICSILELIASISMFIAIYFVVIKNRSMTYEIILITCIILILKHYGKKYQNQMNSEIYDEDK